MSPSALVDLSVHVHVGILPAHFHPQKQTDSFIIFFRRLPSAILRDFSFPLLVSFSSLIVSANKGFHFLIEVHTLAVIGQQSLIVLRELSHNFIGTHGLELGRVRPNTEVGNLSPGKLQTEQEEGNLAQRWLHPVPGPGPDYTYKDHE